MVRTTRIGYIRRDETALNILGHYGGGPDNKPHADLTALKKLKDSKLDQMDTDTDSRTAGLIMYIFEHRSDC